MEATKNARIQEDSEKKEGDRWLGTDKSQAGGSVCTAFARFVCKNLNLFSMNERDGMRMTVYEMANV